jgi:hypothetical protein
MKLDGHQFMTDTAVREFLKEAPAPVAAFAYNQLVLETEIDGVTTRKGVGDAAVRRDLIDVVSTGHWSDFAQKHHFMRRFDGQSPRQAYEEACEWIRSNALKYANSAVKGMGSLQLQALGNAAHAIEDSFAGGHTSRDAHQGPTQPGPITNVKLYSGHDKDHVETHDGKVLTHSEADKTWGDAKKGTLTLEGTVAKNAVKALLKMIFDEVMRARAAKIGSLASLSGWGSFKDKWLAASSRLSVERDGAIDLVDDFYRGVVWGDTNTAFNFDEKGMANAIYSKLGADTKKVYDAFHRLNEYHTVDADDVAELYVNKLRKGSDLKIPLAVKGDERLVGLLVSIMKAGWTSDGEQECIDYLQSGKGR